MIFLISKITILPLNFGVRLKFLFFTAFGNKVVFFFFFFFNTPQVSEVVFCLFVCFLFLASTAGEGFFSPLFPPKNIQAPLDIKWCTHYSRDLGVGGSLCLFLHNQVCYTSPVCLYFFFSSPGWGREER